MKTKEVCERIINSLIEEGYKFQIPKINLEKAIMQHRGIDERTVARWIKALITFEYLTQVSHNTYQLNPLATPQLSTLLKEKPQTKMM